MISKASKLCRLQIYEDEAVDLEKISVCFPQLIHLSLRYDLRDGVLNHGLQGLSLLGNVAVLELGWISINDLFAVEVAGWGFWKDVKLVVHSFVSEVKTHEEC